MNSSTVLTAEWHRISTEELDSNLIFQFALKSEVPLPPFPIARSVTFALYNRVLSPVSYIFDSRELVDNTSKNI